jgi:hypothetical protein
MKNFQTLIISANRLGNYAINLARGYAIGKGLEKSSEAAGRMIQELLRFKITVPSF